MEEEGSDEGSELAVLALEAQMETDRKLLSRDQEQVGGAEVSYLPSLPGTAGALPASEARLSPPPPPGAHSPPTLPSCS